MINEPILISWLDYCDKYDLEFEQLKYRPNVKLKKQHATTINLPQILENSSAIIMPDQISSKSDLYPPKFQYLLNQKWLNIITGGKEQTSQEKSLTLLNRIRDINKNIPIIIVSKNSSIIENQYLENGANLIYTFKTKSKKDLDDIIIEYANQYKQSL